MAEIAKEAEVQPDAPVLEGISRLATYLWNETWKHGDGTASGDAEALHDMRVAIRRLRSLLQNFEGDKGAPILNENLQTEFRDERRRLGRLGDLLGYVRDHDVLDEYLKTYAQARLKIKLDARATEYSGLLAFERFLQVERATAFAPMVKRLNKARRPHGLQEGFARFALGLPAAHAPSISLRDVAHRLLLIRLDEVLAHAPALDDTHAEEEQHEVRKSLRRLRYTFETLAPCFKSDVKPHIKSLVQLQDLLGEMQDRSVLHAKALEAFGMPAPQVASTPGNVPSPALPADVAAFLKYGAGRRRRLLTQVRSLWKKHQADGFFESLRKL